MKRALTTFAVLIVFAGLAAPSFAQYAYSWSDNFDWANAGSDLGGQNGWVKAGGTTAQSGKLISPAGWPAPNGAVLSGTHAYQQVPLTGSMVKHDLTALNSNHGSYYNAAVMFWMWDPFDKTGNVTDSRAGVYSSAGSGTQCDSGSMTYCIGAGVTSNRSQNYWEAYASSGFIAMDGTAADAVGGAGGGVYKLHVNGLLPATRVAGWNNLVILFTASKAAGTMHAEFYVNQLNDSPAASCVLDAAAPNSRYAGILDVAGLFMGSGSGWTKPMTIDDAQFWADSWGSAEPVDPPWLPEPSSFLALGAGLLSLVGLARRRRGQRVG